MLFLKLIITNLRRHRVRTLFGVAGIALSVAAMLTVITVLQGAIGMFERILSTDSEIVVFERNVSDLFFSNVSDSAGREIASWSIVKRACPVLFGIVSSPDHPIITCFGVSESDARLRDSEWLSGRCELFGQVTNGVVLGARAAEFMNAGSGREVPIGRELFPVIGVVKTANGFEDGGVFMPLKAAQAFFHKEGSSSVITVKLARKEDKTAFKKMVESQYQNLVALENAEFSRSYSQFKILKATAWAVGACGLILGGLGVANTMIMSVFTRIREIAILRVTGFSDLQIVGVIFGESAVVSGMGAAAGLALGFAALAGLQAVPILHGYIDRRLELRVLLGILSLVACTGLAGALYPAIYAMRIRPVEALRFE